MIATLHFILMGFLGAVAYILIWAKAWKDVKAFESVRHLIIGAIIGYVYYVAYSEYDFPNLLMCFIAGYMGPDAIAGLIEKLKPKKEGR